MQLFILLNCKFTFNFFACFYSVDIVGSMFSFWNCFVDCKVRPFSIYLFLFMFTTPLPLSCFMMIILFVFIRLLRNFFWCLGTLILQYFSHELLSLVLISTCSFLRILEISFKRFCKKCSNSVHTEFY